MRIRIPLVAIAASLLVPVLAAPAAAGTGTGNWCGDGITNPGGLDVPILTYPLTVGVEVFNNPLDPRMQQIRVCFSDTPPGQPSRIAGGSVALGVWTDTGSARPGGYVRLECLPDVGPTGAWPSCHLPIGANVAPGDVRAATYSTGYCLVMVGTNCAAYLPGVHVDPDYTSTPLLSITLLGTPFTANLPECIPVVVPC
jgi:hypothetical protein